VFLDETAWSVPGNNFIIARQCGKKLSKRCGQIDDCPGRLDPAKFLFDDLAVRRGALDQKRGSSSDVHDLLKKTC
jgi:hypothetical protein